MSYRIPEALIGEENAKLAAAHAEDYSALGRRLRRGGVDIEAITAKAAAFAVAVPTWGVGTGGTRFARFPGPGEPRGIFDKLEDCATIHQLTPRNSDLLAAFSVGQGRRLSRAGRASARAWRRLRRGQFQHLPGPARPAAVL